MTPESIKLLYLTAGAVASLILLVAWLRIHAFLALLFAALVVGLGACLLGVTIMAPDATGLLAERALAPTDIAKAFQDGIGKNLGGIAAVLGLGTMLGGLLAASGGAEVLSQRLVNVFGIKRVNWVLMIVALAVGFTTWFAVGLIMLLPILLTLTKETKQPFLKLALPMLAVLSIMHGVMPPHPGPLVALAELNANLGKVILWGLVAAIPIAAISGPIFAKWAVKNVDVTAPEPPPVDPNAVLRSRPSLARTVAALAFPVILILTHTISELTLPKTHQIYKVTEIIGNPTLALALAVLFAAWAFRFNRTDALKIVEKSLGPVGMTLLLVGGGGGFNNVLQVSKAATAIGEMAATLALPTMLFGWVCAALIRIATGSATVAIIAAVGLVKPLAAVDPNINPELLVVAIGCGSMILSHVNDAGFWIVKESLGLTVSQTLRTWTVTETLIGITGLAVAWGLDLIF